MMDFLRPYLSRILSAALAAGIGALVTKLGIDTTSVDQAQLAGALGTFLSLVIYALGHKAIDKKVNPADTASKHLAVAGKIEAEQMKSPEGGI